MNVNYKNKDFQFNLRVSAIIVNKELTKVLLYQFNNKDYYLLPGGRVGELEHSHTAIKREILEEIGEEFSNLNYEYMCTSEEFVKSEEYYYHQINIIYKALYDKDIKETNVKSLEGDWNKYKWIDIDKIDKLNIYPTKVKEIIKGKSINHIVEDLINKGE